MIAIIPARKNSKGLPHKNQGLVKYSLDFAQGYFNVIVSTDDPKITGPRVHKRPKHLATDQANLRDVMISVRDHYEIAEDMLVLLPTYPKRDHEDLLNALKLWELYPEAHSLLCGYPCYESAYLQFTSGDYQQGRPVAPTIYRRQERPKTFLVSHYLVIVQPAYLEHLDPGFWDETTVFLQLDKKPLDIDTREDLDQL